MTEKLNNITMKKFWCSLIEDQIYLMGVGFPREYYAKSILPKKTVKTLKEFWHKCEDIRIKCKFELSNAGFYTPRPDWPLVKQANQKADNRRHKLIKRILG